MKRRDFLTSVPIALGGMTLKAYTSSPMLDMLTNSLTDTDHILVIIQLSGGNDGLNMVIPLDQYSTLSGLRSNILIPEQQVLKLSGTNGATGLHPAMTGLFDLYNNGRLGVIQNVGYPNFNYSHFTATDIWMSGIVGNQSNGSGWAGRYLNYEYPNYPVGFPNNTIPHPLAIRIGGNVGLGLQHMGVNMGISINNTNDPLNLTGSIYTDPAPADCRGDKLKYVREVQRQTDKFGDAVQDAATKGCNASNLYPTGAAPGASLAGALKTVAKLICGGLQTRIYWVSTGGFDTHSNQVNAGDHTQGTHANLLKGVSDSIAAFMDDLKYQGMANKVMGLTFSEFGRRIISNASGGTDHGAAMPMFVFGNPVNAGVYGSNPIIPAGATANTNLPMQHDFRSVYASILQDWFCIPQADLSKILLNNYQNINLVSNWDCIRNPQIRLRDQESGEVMLEAYPNPFVERTKLKFTADGGYTLIQVFDEEGDLIATPVDGDMLAGEQVVDLDLGYWPAGIYFCRLQVGGQQQVKTLVKVRG
jgi:uncharacterized protein (DUF1501 family)